MASAFFGIWRTNNLRALPRDGVWVGLMTAAAHEQETGLSFQPGRRPRTPARNVILEITKGTSGSGETARHGLLGSALQERAASNSCVSAPDYSNRLHSGLSTPVFSSGETPAGMSVLKGMPSGVKAGFASASTSPM